jgi:hypothetical protein
MANCFKAKALANIDDFTILVRCGAVQSAIETAPCRSPPLLTAVFRFTGDPGLAGPWVLDKLGVPMQELGCRSCKDSLELSIRSLHPRPEGRGFPRITGKN